MLLENVREWYVQFFFFQAEDGIRDRNVTGVQTCALPISGIERSIKVTVRDPSFADVQGLPIRSKRRLNFESPIRWVETRSIITGEPKWIPRELIDLDTTQIYDGFFVSSSNGLASGNSRIEAVLHGLSEIVERDQVSHWLIAENLSIGSPSRRL